MFIRTNKRAFYVYPSRRFYSSTSRVIKNNTLPAPAYQPCVVEKNKYNEWEKTEIFKAQNSSNQPAFSMVLPPPNVTGKLHLGHALACTVQDVVVRRKRCLGYNVLWLPGTDHAGIATQGVVERHLKSKLNVDRRDMTQEEFTKEVWKWKEVHGNTIRKQLKKLGCSLDWSREIFTLDQKHTNAVNKAFCELFNKGLIYRKKALVNWCSGLNSTVSDIEVENVAIDKPKQMMLPGCKKPVTFGLIYSFAYKVYNSDEEVIVSTTMPETMLGDTAVAVHSEDKRYRHLKGKNVTHPFTKRNIPIIFDDFVDKEFASGAVKITPAHSKIDYEVAKRHNLPMIQVINENGQIMNSETFDELDRYECRHIILNMLDELGLLRDVKEHKMSLPVCSRTGSIIEYIPKEQWFLSCRELNKQAGEVVKNGLLKMEPAKFEKNWIDWTKDGRDWCISRQLWWGHQIPAYECKSGDDICWVAATNETDAKIEASKQLRTMPVDIDAKRDSDVLDTWFSSAIYPFASLGWETNEIDYRTFYPLNLMATGHDILGFWVHRMVLLGLELTGKLPFENVLLHGVICDNKGMKMSKSRGNVIDPIDIIDGISLPDLLNKAYVMREDGILNKEEAEKAREYYKRNFSNSKGIPQCGVDALRFTLLSQDIKSHYINFDMDICHSNKLFCNKIWQSVNYTQLAFAKLPRSDMNVTKGDLTFFDKWILSRLASMILEVNNTMDDNEFHLATKALRKFIYNDFCDVYLEATKPGFEGNDITSFAHAHTLSVVLNTSLRCLAPFMVYITEELIPRIPQFEENIIYNFKDGEKKVLEFPQYKDFQSLRNEEIERDVLKVINAVNLVRQMKGLFEISNKERSTLSIYTKDENLQKDIEENKIVIMNLTRCKDIVFEDFAAKNYVSGVYDEKTKIGVEVVGKSVKDVVLTAKPKLAKRVTKAERHIFNMEEKINTEYYTTTTSEWTKQQDIEKLMNKREELKLLQGLIELC